MEHSSIILDDGTGKEFDARVRGPGILQDGADLIVVTKDHGTEEGRPVVLLTFTVMLPDGMVAKAQTVITGRIFQAIAAGIHGKYGNI